jgi:IS4 transposase
MNKSKFFTGQPIFGQLLSLLTPVGIGRIAAQHGSDYYCKRFSTYDHLVTMLYGVYNHCTALREVTTGLLAWEQRIKHLGLLHHPRRSTLSDANNRREATVFEEIYKKILDQYQPLLSDSRPRNKAARLYSFDSTTVSLFQEVLRTSGRPALNGKRKGGIKVHTLMRSDQDVPCLIRYSSAASNDSQFLKEIKLAKGSVIVFDRGYKDYKTFNRFTEEQITWVTRLRKRTASRTIRRLTISEYCKKQGVSKDQQVELGHTHHRQSTKVSARIVTYRDAQTREQFTFLTNNLTISPLTVANYYRKRWQIELLFKRLKQNYPLHYFLGDSQNAIQIQIWCVLIADLLLKVIKKQNKCSWSFSNLCALVRLHLMTYLELKDFINCLEKALLKKIQQVKSSSYSQSLFPT